MQSFARSLKELAPEKRWGLLGAATARAVRRTEHGGAAFQAKGFLVQPQDGASRSIGIAKNSLRMKHSTALIGEPEDARITGGTRSLMRRAMGLNFGAMKPQPKMVAKGITVKRPAAA